MIQHQTDDTGTLAELFPGCIVHSADHWIAELECRKCGERFHIHPYALFLGVGCPKCDRKRIRMRYFSANFI